MFGSAAVKVSGGTFTIRTLGNSNENRYIQSGTLNGKAYTKAYIDHTDIAVGGELVFRMGPEPKVWYCADEADQKVLKMSAPFLLSCVIPSNTINPKITFHSKNHE